MALGKSSTNFKNASFGLKEIKKVRIKFKQKYMA